MKIHNYGTWIYCITNKQWYCTAEDYIEFLKANRGKTHWVTFYVNGVVQRLPYRNWNVDMESLLENKSTYSLVSPLRAWIKPLPAEWEYLPSRVAPMRMD